MTQVVIVTSVVVALALNARAVARYARDSIASVGHADLRWAAIAVVAEFASMSVFARLQRLLLRVAGARVPLHTMLQLTYAANALSVSLPAGSAVSSGYLMRRLRTVGASTAAIGFALVSSGLLSTLALAVLSLTAGVLVGGGVVSAAIGAGELAVAAGLAWLACRITTRPATLRRPAAVILHGVNRMRHAPPERDAAELYEVLSKVAGIRMRRRDWGLSGALAGANWLADLICLLAACRAVGAQVPVPVVALAFLAGAAASSLSLLPGGIGTVEAAIILTLTHGGLGVQSATTSALLYRLVSFVLIVVIGWVAWTIDRRQVRRTVVDTARVGTAAAWTATPNSPSW